MSIFDKIIDRHNTESYKWDFFNDPTGTISMPVADMDFHCPKVILDALDEVTAHGIMGYSIVPDSLHEIFQKRLSEKYAWNTEKVWQVWVPGLIPALTGVCQMVGNNNDAILTPIPAYYPIHLAPNRVGKELQTIPMWLSENRWTLDFDALEKAITAKTKLFVLCNPHNPGGTVFTLKELQRLVDICCERDIIICSDEIHCDLILNSDKAHIPIASLSSKAEERTITLMAPSKTFNIAGLGCSVAIISNQELRQQFEVMKMSFFPFLSRYSIKAAEAAYAKGETWRKDLVSYLKNNHDYLLREINVIEGLNMQPLEATYLAWIKTDIPDFTEKLLSKGVRVVDGGIYLKNGYFRLNFACPKKILEIAVERIREVAAM